MFGVGVVGRIERALGDGYVPGLRDKPGELGDRDRAPLNREAADPDLAHGSLFGVEVSGTHPEPAAGDFDHVVAVHRPRS